MGGENPYIQQAATELPQKPFKITFVSEDKQKVVQVDPNELPERGDGLKGSLLRYALANGVKIDHACGGVCACSTCHVILKQGQDSCNEAIEEEEDQLDNAPGLVAESRLACQCVPNGQEDLIVEVPSWNRNLISEEH